MCRFVFEFEMNMLLAHATAVEMPIGGDVCVFDNESTKIDN